MKATRHNGRSGKHGTYDAKHNDRRFDVENSEHIDAERTKMNVYWDCYQGYSLQSDKDERARFTFTEIEKAYYVEKYSDHVDGQNERNRKARHYDRVKTIDAILENNKTCPEETLLQLGNMDGAVSADVLAQVSAEYFEEFNRRYGSHVHILDWALHLDEATPHIHERHVFDAVNQYGELCPQQDKALEELGFELPKPNEKKGKYNNRKMVFDEECRKLFISICQNHGLTIDVKPVYGGASYLEKQDFIIMNQKKRIEEKQAVLDGLVMKIEDVNAVIEEAVDLAYEKACEVVTKRVKEETVKHDVDVVKDYGELLQQVAIIERQIDEIELAIAQAKADNGERYTIKQMEKSRKSLLTRLEKLNDASRKDNVVTFEQLGVDRLFVDESHDYKNLFLYTKMRNVAGIAQSEAQKSSDMFAKCQYLDELTGGKGVTFATGTPISNSMTELYTNMRYLQYGTLQKLGLGHFDTWASSFGETQAAIELAPEGTGYRAKTRFAKFFNLPELIALFKESADIQTPDMLNLPVQEAEYENVVLKPSEYQKDMVASLAERAEAVRDRQAQPYEDNMLKITNDGRKLALDQRLINDMLPDDENSKASTCVEKAFEIWEQTKEQKSTQLIFCDLSTPKGDGTFNVYEDIRNKLIEKGVPPEEIAFIHEANTELRKAELFGKVRSGQVRFLLGSTQKMGAGTNVQDRLIALHHLDVPWRPSDIEQQEGRILRQGNLNPKVKIFRYVTEGTFDSYSWQLIENKQKFIGQIMTSKSPVRSCEDVDEADSMQMHPQKECS